MIAENPVAHSELWWRHYFITSLRVSPHLVAAVGSISLRRTSETNPLPVTALLERTFCVCLDFFFSFFFFINSFIFLVIYIWCFSRKFFFFSGLVHKSYYSCYNFCVSTLLQLTISISFVLLLVFLFFCKMEKSEVILDHTRSKTQRSQIDTSRKQALDRERTAEGTKEPTETVEGTKEPTESSEIASTPSKDSEMDRRELLALNSDSDEDSGEDEEVPIDMSRPSIEQLLALMMKQTIDEKKAKEKRRKLKEKRRKKEKQLEQLERERIEEKERKEREGFEKQLSLLQQQITNNIESQKSHGEKLAKETERKDQLARANRLEEKADCITKTLLPMQPGEDLYSAMIRFERIMVNEDVESFQWVPLLEHVSTGSHLTC